MSPDRVQTRYCESCGKPGCQTVWLGELGETRGNAHLCASCLRMGLELLAPSKMPAAVPFAGPGYEFYDVGSGIIVRTADGTYNLKEMKQTIERLTNALVHVHDCGSCRDDGWGHCDRGEQGQAAEALLRELGRLP